MRRRVSTGLLFVCMMSCAVSAQTRPIVSLIPAGSTRISPGGVVEVEAFVDNVPDPVIRIYQTEIQIVPLAGASGSISLANVAEPIFIDQTRQDYLYFGATGTVIAEVVELLLRLGSAVFELDDSAAATTPKYLGTYLLQASPDADGDFRIEFVHPGDDDANNTFLVHRDNVDQVIPFDPVPTTITVALQPENDDCTNAAIATNGTTSFNTDNTTTDGLPLSTSCDEGGGTALENDIWFDYTATCTGILTVSTCNSADFDTRLAIYGSGTATCACPTGNTTLLACDDNTAGCAGGTSRTTLNVTQGNCYKIRVGGAVAGATGTGNLTITCVGNDTCASAQAVGTPSTTNGATVGATTDTNLPVCGPVQSSPGVWYTVTGTGGRMTASLCSAASYDTRLTVFQGNCGALTCVANANDTCGNRESISWCSAAGATYKILVSGNSGLSGTFSLALSSQSCNDNNACTNDACSGAQCTNTINFDDTVSCCTPSTGALCTIDDDNPCTNDSCNSPTGTCVHSPVPNGPEPACDDGVTCTFDQCLNGACGFTDINTISCSGDPDCPNGNFCDTDSGLCICVPAPTVELVADPGLLPVASCYSADAGDLVRVRIEMGFAPPQEPIIGGQFFLAYDPLTLDFISIEPGSTVDAGSPFSFELAESVNEVAGTIDYGVLDFDGGGTSAASTLAVITFRAIAECDPFVVFRPSGPNGLPNRLTAAGGVEVLPDDLIDLPPISTNGSPPVISGCPADIVTGTDIGQFQATVMWGQPTATDSCDGSITVTCSPPSGSGFPIGTTTVTCSAANSCGLTASCSFDVTVQPASLTVDVQLSPTMVAGPIDRCITFDLWNCSAPAPENHATVDQTISFTSGLATGVTIPIPGGQWECITARDRLHALRSTAADFATTNGTDFTATFVGDRATAGHWLVNGNLNDDQFIDILDFAVFLDQFLRPASPGSPCGTAAPHANVNGDNVVDLVDFVFVQVNSFMAHEPNCCGAPGVAGAEAPRTEISVRDLRRLGLYHLRFADLNHDGWIDTADIAAFLDGERPSEVYKRPKASRFGGNSRVRKSSTKSE